MPTTSRDRIREEVVDRLDPHSSAGARTTLTGVIDEDALEDEQYDEVLATVEDRLSHSRFTLVSMLVSGIYFGLLVGFWLLEWTIGDGLLRWGLPVLLVMTYGIYSTHQTTQQLRQLAEARALLLLLVRNSNDSEDPPE